MAGTWGAYRVNGSVSSARAKRIIPPAAGAGIREKVRGWCLAPGWWAGWLVGRWYPLG